MRGQDPFDATVYAALLGSVSERSPFNRWLGLQIAEVPEGEGEVELHLPWRKELCQYDGFLHAGVVAALLDTVCGFAAVTVVGGVLASHVAIRYLRPAISELFIARGRVVKPGRLQIFAVGELFGITDGDAKPFATADVLFVPLPQEARASSA